MRIPRSLAVLAVLGVGVFAALLGRSRAERPDHSSPPSKSGNIVVTLCDGQTSAEIPGVREGQQPTHAQAQAVVDQLMAEWRQKNPDVHWEDTAQLAQANPPGQAAPAPAGIGHETAGGREGAAQGAEEAGQAERRGSTTPGEAAAGGATRGGAGGLPAAAQGDLQSGQTYGAFTQRDEKIWAAETEKFVQQGKAIFHDAQAVSSANAISCDMCHPDGSNTHPETYPKFQVQLGRVALLRDMINWCIQNPSRGKPMADDDPRLKAMEAYILAQRKGVALELGKH